MLDRKIGIQVVPKLSILDFLFLIFQFKRLVKLLFRYFLVLGPPAITLLPYPHWPTKVQRAAGGRDLQRATRLKQHNTNM